MGVKSPELEEKLRMKQILISNEVDASKAKNSKETMINMLSNIPTQNGKLLDTLVALKIEKPQNKIDTEFASSVVKENPCPAAEIEDQSIKNQIVIERTIPFEHGEDFDATGIDEYDGSEVLTAVFRGLNQDVEAALMALNKDIESRTVDYGVSEFSLWDTADISFVMKNYPSLKAVMFIEDWSAGEVDTAYSESGYPCITTCWTAGECDFHGEMRWSLEHLPTESHFRATGEYTNTGDRYTVDYEFEMQDDWEAMNYVVTIDGELRQITGIRESDIPEFVTEEIGAGTLRIVAYNGSATHLMLPEKYNNKVVTEINLEKKPKHVDKIKLLTVPEGYKKIGGFANFVSLEKVILPQSMDTILCGAFRGCKNLEEVVLSDNVRFIYDEAFAECPKLKKFYLPARLQGGCLEREYGGIDGRVGRWLFRNSGICELYVNAPTIDPEGTDCLKGCRNYVIYALPGSPFFEDKRYRKHTKEYPATSRTALYEVHGVVFEHLFAEQKGHSVIDASRNIISHNINSVCATISGQMRSWDGLHYVVEGKYIYIFNHQNYHMGTIEFRKDIAAVMQKYSVRIDNFVQKDGSRLCTFDVILDDDTAEETTLVAANGIKPDSFDYRSLLEPLHYVDEANNIKNRAFEFPMIVPVKRTPRLRGERKLQMLRIESINDGDPLILEVDRSGRVYSPVGVEVFNAKHESLGYLEGLDCLHGNKSSVDARLKKSQIILKRYRQEQFM